MVHVHMKWVRSLITERKTRVYEIKKKNKNIIHNEGAVATVVATVPLLVTFDHTITCRDLQYYILRVYTYQVYIYLCIP